MGVIVKNIKKGGLVKSNKTCVCNGNDYSSLDLKEEYEKQTGNELKMLWEANTTYVDEDYSNWLETKIKQHLSFKLC
jgi:hypothetical protein